MQPNYSQLIAGMAIDDNGILSGNITDNWMQGRTTYGGLSAALCLHAVQSAHSDLPPLRAASINFIGPAGGDIEVRTSKLRQGKSVTFITAELYGEKGLATHAVFSFGKARESRFDTVFSSCPILPEPDDSEDFFKRGPGPQFTSNFDCRLALGGLPISGSDASEHYIWTRHKDKSATDMVALLCLADMPPPAVLPMFKEFAPVSSMTWSINLLSDDLSTKDGWWLMRTAAEHARDGYSSQDMQIWNSKRELVLSGRQNVAIFY